MRLAVPVLPSIVLCACALWLSLGAADGADAAEAIAPDSVKGVLPALEGMAQDAIRTGEVPGLAVAVVAGDEVVFLKGYGVREAGKPDAVGPDTVFQLASCSKPIASSVAAALVRQGGLGGDPLASDLREP
jgi:CubicO group peptidase (beta-lactamase class C family)